MIIVGILFSREFNKIVKILKFLLLRCYIREMNIYLWSLSSDYCKIEANILISVFTHWVRIENFVEFISWYFACVVTPFYILNFEFSLWDRVYCKLFLFELRLIEDFSNKLNLSWNSLGETICEISCFSNIFYWA